LDGWKDVNHNSNVIRPGTSTNDTIRDKDLIKNNYSGDQLKKDIRSSNSNDLELNSLDRNSGCDDVLKELENL
jgi:hypothetical protein